MLVFVVNIMVFKTCEGLSIDYFIERNNKSKEFIVFLHGLAGDYSEFHHQMLFFKKNYSIIAPSFLGHGKSSKPLKKEYYSPNFLATKIIELLKKEKIINPIIIGFSLGGLIACKVAQKIKAKKIILINPAFGKKSITIFFKISSFLSFFAPKFILKFFVKSNNIYEYNGLLDEYAKMLIKTPKHVIKSIIYHALKSNEKSFLKKKVFVIKSKNDEIVNDYLPLKNYEKFLVNGFHLVHVQNHGRITELLNEILKN